MDFELWFEVVCTCGIVAVLVWQYHSPAVSPSRAAVPQGEFDKSLSVCFDRPIHPPLGQLEILQVISERGYLIYASPREVWSPEVELVA